MFTIGDQIKVEELVDKWEIPLAEFTYQFVQHDVTGHDFYHCLRVKQLALRIAEGENLDKDIMVATAYLHDIGRDREYHNEGDHVEFGVITAREILPKIDFPSAKIGAVAHCIEYHEFYQWGGNRSNNRVLSEEALGFQDADRLDAIGAIGIARIFAFAGAYGLPMWMPEIAPSLWQHGKISSSAYNHLLEKLVKIKDGMNTITGKHMADARHRFVESFSIQFESEWFGKI